MKIQKTLQHQKALAPVFALLTATNAVRLTKQ